MTTRPSSITIDDANDQRPNAPTSPVAAMEDLALSPTLQRDEEGDEEYDLASASKLIPLSMTDSVSGERPLPSLHSPLMFRDVPFIGLFALHLVVALLVTGAVRDDGEHEQLEDERRDVVGGLQDALDSQDNADVGVALRSLSIVNVLFSLGWLLLFIFYSKLRFVQGSCLFSMGGLTALAVMLVLLDSSDGVFWGIVCSSAVVNILTIIASGTTMIWYYRNESSEISPDIREEIPDHDPAVADQAQPDASGDGTSSLSNMDRKVVLHYARCAMSSSFGSVCIGSLLCPLAHIVWNVLRWARRDESVLSRRFISLRSERAEHFIRTYHKYSFVHIAGYNKPYYVAAQDAWRLIELHGVEAIVDDDLTSRILLLGGNGWAGIMSALTVSALAGGSTHITFFTLAAFTLCYTTISLATQVIAAVIKTLFVCFAENPGRLSQLHPLIYHRFVRLAELKSFRDHKAPSGLH
ncbi:hypothetical protein BBJ29_001340 [Phytophthora kernoviae]|uniref:Choline transporter-like protein n=1 Tax=Phytophthora kernoviae TaxID=325452 RepID=A0A3F2RU51_9STRA|nr:hypothetical protein BBJ29_001340 [Phytophthora kernoviae]RLN64278.1 hypothetical protein BBP00_00003541 [Phytophthora kernoviae]